MKLGKEIKFDVSPNFNTSIGTLNKNESKSIYLTVSAWGEPISNQEKNYSRVINNISKAIKQKLYDGMDEKFFDKNRVIVDVDIRESGVKFGKKSYAFIDVTLFQTSNLKFKDEKLQNYSKQLCTMILETIDKNQNFKFQKKKKSKQ